MAEGFDLTQLIYLVKDDRMAELRNSDGLRFIGHCLSHASISTSQNYQDVFAAVVNRFQPGFFVEFGATNGVEGSNTVLLEKLYGWTGVLAEPNPAHQDALAKNRRADISQLCIHNETGLQLPFIVTDEPDLSTLAGYGKDDEHADKRSKGFTIVVDTITLFDFLNKFETPKVIDYLSVDTEGSEYDILKKFFEENNGEYKFKAVTVEHNYNVEKRDNIHKLMTENGYTRMFTEFSRWDDFYVGKV